MHLLPLQTYLLLKYKCGRGHLSQFRNQKKVTVSALFCILMDNPWYTKGFSIRDIPHTTLEEEEIFVGKKTWYRLLRKYYTA